MIQKKITILSGIKPKADDFKDWSQWSGVEDIRGSM